MKIIDVAPHITEVFRASLIRPFCIEKNQDKKELEFLFRRICLKQRLDYWEYVEKVKEILNASEVDYYEDIVIINYDRRLEYEERLALVRLVNLTYKGLKFIVLNNSIIFVPLDIRERTKNSEIIEYIENKLMRYKRKKSLLWRLLGFKYLIPDKQENQLLKNYTIYDSLK